MRMNKKKNKHTEKLQNHIGNQNIVSSIKIKTHENLEWQ